MQKNMNSLEILSNNERKGEVFMKPFINDE